MGAAPWWLGLADSFKLDSGRGAILQQSRNVTVLAVWGPCASSNASPSRNLFPSSSAHLTQKLPHPTRETKKERRDTKPKGQAVAAPQTQASSQLCTNHNGHRLSSRLGTINVTNELIGIALLPLVLTFAIAWE